MATSSATQTKAEEKATAPKRVTEATTATKPRQTSPKVKPANGSMFSTGGAVIGAAAAGLLAGLAANLGRKVAVQAVSASAGDWFDSLKAEHRHAMKLFGQLEKTTSRQTTRRAMLLTQLKHALAKHAFEEENTVYPALRDSGETAEADSLNHDHGYVKQFLYDLETMPRDSQAWMMKLGSFREALEKHIREEEDDIFPKLKSRLSDEQNGKLTTAMNREGFKLA